MDKLDFILEKYINGDATKEEIDLIESRKDLMERADALRVENKAFLELYPARVFLTEAKNAEKKAKTPMNIFQKLMVPLTGVLSFGLALVLFIQPEIERTKGGDSALYINKLTKNGIEQLASPALIKPFESIQIEYSHGTNSYGAIFSVDSKGSVNLHFPNSISESSKLSQKSRVPLDYAYTLDDTPGQEVFYFFLSNNEVDLNKISNGLKLNNDPKSFGYETRIFILKKQEVIK